MSFVKRIFSHLFLCAFACVVFAHNAFGATAAFSVTTTNLPAGTAFTFKISASGTFYVDCGTDGTLSGNGVDVDGITIDRSNTTTDDTYTCTYSSGDVKTIEFNGTATDYNTDTSVAAISFYNNTYVNELSGDLSTIFPEVGNLPSFVGAFSVCTNLTTIPSTLFEHITTAKKDMFSSVFWGDTSLTVLPSGLFSNVVNTSNAENLFRAAFYGCTGLTSIPNDLFAGITTGAKNMFYSTFYDCTGLTTTIPSSLFSNITTGAQGLFHQTFANCTGLISIPQDLFAGITTGVKSMFSSTFYGCTGLTSIPSALFSRITTGAENMFHTTFSGCTGLTYLPEGLFAGIADAKENMFYATFWNCSNLGNNVSASQTFIPSTLFAGLVNAGSPQATGMMMHTFADTNLATLCPSGYQEYNTGYDFDGKVSCVSVQTSTGPGQGTIACQAGYYPNNEGTACEPGYEITLISGNNCQNVWVPQQKLYTIKNVGLYIGPERSADQLMLPQSDNGGKNPITLPKVTYTAHFNSGAFAPTNPVTGQPYVPKNPSTGDTWDPLNPEAETKTNSATFHFDNYFDNKNYIKDIWHDWAIGFDSNKSWLVSNYTGGGVQLDTHTYIPGYNMQWVDEHENNLSSQPFGSGCNTLEITVYAKYSATSANITYELGNGEWGVGAVHHDSITYDQEIDVSHPVPLPGYEFTGWNITNINGSNIYYSDSPIIINNVYQSATTTEVHNATSLSGITATHFMNLRQIGMNVNIIFTATYRCASGYESDDNGNCVIQCSDGYHPNASGNDCDPDTYTVTYYSGNCDPNSTNNTLGTTYSATDPVSAATGQSYNVLSYTNTTLNGVNGADFSKMYDDIDDGGFGVPDDCATFMGWKDPNINGTDVDYTNCNANASTTAFCSPTISPYNYGDNLNLYAYCEYGRWTVYYTGCDGTLIKTESLKFGDAFYTPTSVETFGYTFNGWKLRVNAQQYIPLGNTFPANLCIKGLQKISLHADCTPEEYEIRYNNINGATWDSGQNYPIKYTYGVGATIGVPTRANERFLGWCVGSNNGNCQDYTNNATGYTIPTTQYGIVYLWAIWSNQWTLNFVDGAPDGATVNGMPDPASITLGYGTEYPLPSGLTASGYVFNGWECKTSGNVPVEQFYDSSNNYHSSIQMPASDVTCTALWAKVNVNLKWYDDGAVSNLGNPSTSCWYGHNNTFNLPTPKGKTGSVFSGWKVTDWKCDLSFIDPNINGTAVPSFTSNSPWIVEFSYGKLSGRWKCGNSQNNPTDCQTVGSATGNTCGHCWCQLTDFLPTGGTQCNISSTPWVYVDELGDCGNACSTHCAMRMHGDSNFRAAALTQSND